MAIVTSRSGVASRNAIACFACAALVQACASEAPDATRAVRDSAGVRIIENTASAWSSADAWRLAAAPSVEIGGDETDPSQQFVRIMSAFRLLDGRLVAANFESPPEIRFFTAGGEHQFSVGGSGKGPGEFGAIAWAQRVTPDTILVYDFWNSRFTYFDWSGGLLTSVRIERSRAIPTSQSYQARLDDGSLLQRPNRFFIDPRPGIHRDSTTWLRGLPDGSLIDTIGRFPGRTYHYEGQGRPSELLFGARSAVTARGTAVYLAPGDEFRIDRYDLGGALDLSMRAHFERRRVTGADLGILKELQLQNARNDNERRLIERRFLDSHHAELMPAHGSHILLDTESNIWLEEFNYQPDVEVAWSVFTAEGVYVGAVAMPHRFQPFDVGSDYVLGVWKDDLDVEHVQLYELIKP